MLEYGVVSQKMSAVHSSAVQLEIVLAPWNHMINFRN
jgi:hypothetical protein